MKINWEESQVGTKLKTINIGGCFIYGNVLYMKTDTEEQQSDPNFIKIPNFIRIMVVDLDDGTVDYLSSDVLVTPVEAEINFVGN